MLQHGANGDRIQKLIPIISFISIDVETWQKFGVFAELWLIYKIKKIRRFKMPGEHVFQVKLVPYSNSEWERIVQNCTVVNILNWPIYNLKRYLCRLPSRICWSYPINAILSHHCEILIDFQNNSNFTYSSYSSENEMSTLYVYIYIYRLPTRRHGAHKKVFRWSLLILKSKFLPNWANSFNKAI